MGVCGGGIEVVRGVAFEQRGASWAEAASGGEVVGERVKRP